MPYTKPRFRLVAALTALSWLGLFAHNSIELSLINPASAIMAIVAVIFFVGWWRLGFKRVGAALLVFWGIGHLIGGAIITVMPFNFLPFVPPQTLTHYLTHVLYGLAQLPLIVMMVRELRQSR